jgi:hypothetical protein
MHAPVVRRAPPAVIVDVPVRYFQSVIAIEMAIVGVLLFQIKFFDTAMTYGENMIRGYAC